MHLINCMHLIEFIDSILRHIGRFLVHPNATNNKHPLICVLEIPQKVLEVVIIILEMCMAMTLQS